MKPGVMLWSLQTTELHLNHRIAQKGMQWLRNWTEGVMEGVDGGKEWRKEREEMIGHVSHVFVSARYNFVAYGQELWW